MCRNILITGYEGFLGSHLTKTLLGYGANVFGLDILTHRKQTILTDGDFAKIKITKGSVENFSLVLKIIKENKIEFIFHLAAKSLVSDCLQKPIRAFSTNIKGTWNILEASRNSNTIKEIIIASSDKAYGSCCELPYKENTPLSGNHPYDVSKSCTDLIAQSYFHTYKLPVCVTRCGNFFGGGDLHFNRIVPGTIKSILKNERPVVRSNGLLIRDYIYVKDVVEAYLSLAEKMDDEKIVGQAFNFSTDKPFSVLEIIEEISKVTKNSRLKPVILNNATNEIPNQHLSSEKARTLLNWEPKYGVRGGLEETYLWYRKFFEEQSFCRGTGILKRKRVYEEL